MTSKYGLAELKAALVSAKGMLAAVALFSFFVNLLMLTGPLFMLQVYDRVLASRSIPTLLALFALVAFLYLTMGALDYLRGRVLARTGARFQALLDRRVYEAALRGALSPTARVPAATAMRDLDSIRHALAGPAPAAAFDVPWTPVFFAAIFVFHWTLGALAMVGGALLVVLTVLNQHRSKKPAAAARAAMAQSEGFEQHVRRDAETVTGLGMRSATLGRWLQLRDTALVSQVQASDKSGSYAVASKTMRFFLQSAMLALGAALAIEHVVSPGAMIASSILMGRALAPIEQLIGQWAVLQRAVNGWRSLASFLEIIEPTAVRTPLPAPSGRLEVDQLVVVAPGGAISSLRGVSFRLQPGEALGVIGPSASGKSTLARALTGVWRPVAGKVELDGAGLDQWDGDVLGRYIGYLPQEIAIFDGTVTDNIARLDSVPDPEAAVLAAQWAGAHEMILKLPNGYDTRVGPSGSALSGGQRQRLGLARALYGDPVLLVLDEPNAHLDAQGESALTEAIAGAKARGRAVVVMAHRPSAIAACDLLLMLDSGFQRAFGPKDKVLRSTTRNHEQQITASVGEAS